MALTTYRSQAAITNATLRRTALERLADVCHHLITMTSINLLRVELMPDNFIEVDFSNPLPANNVAHLGLTGPV